MIDPVSERRTPLPQSMALRVAVLGVGAFVLFAVIFFRLWYLQVLSGDQYLRQSQVNKVRTESIGAPRGKILDRTGATLVANEQANIITLDPTKVAEVEKQAAIRWGQASAAAADRFAQLKRQRLENIAALRKKGVKAKTARKRYPTVKETRVAIPPIPTAALRASYARLGKVIGLKPATIQERLIVGLWQTPYAPVKLKVGVTDDVRDYLLERREDFPGVTPTQAYIRRYPYKEVAAQIFGTTGQISEAQIKAGTFKDAPQGTIVGQSGLEYQYDQVLRGTDGVERFLVDAQGNRKAQGRATEPVSGRTLKLTIDRRLQLVGQKALANVAGSLPTAFVAMNPETGAIYALGSAPSFDPNVLSRPITQQKYDALFGKDAGSPLFNRAISGGYPVGSTFKPFTSLAALATGDTTASRTINSPPCVNISTVRFCNAGDEDFGSPNLVEALKKSADVYFYQLGAELNNGKLAIQNEARRLGLGRKTGVDLPGEIKGTLPTPAYRRALNAAEVTCRKKNKISLTAPVSAGCGIADGRSWSIGDNVNLSVGQGDVQATPVQMATAYSALANGGKVPTPHLGAEIEDSSQRPLQTITPGAARNVKIDSSDLGLVKQGLLDATDQEGGTSYKVFRGAGWNEDRFPVYGKTGTAERPPYRDQSWFVCWSFDKTGKKPPIVIAATVENAGFGADYAAPAVKQMLAQWFGAASQTKSSTTGATGPSGTTGSTTP